MVRENLGERANTLMKSPVQMFCFMRDAMPSINLIQLQGKYEQRCKPEFHDRIRENLEVLMFFHNLDRDDLSQLSGMSRERISYLTGYTDEKPDGENNIDVEDFLWLGVMLTVNTGHNFERIFDGGFAKELRKHGLCGPTKQSAP